MARARIDTYIGIWSDSDTWRIEPPGRDDRLGETTRIGTAKVKLTHLRFGANGKRVRLPNMTRVQKLVKAFELDGCHRLELEHHIPAQMSQRLLQDALARTGIVLADLTSVDPPFLCLQGEESLLCYDGQHRSEAARLFYSDIRDHWWPVSLYCENGSQAGETAPSAPHDKFRQVSLKKPPTPGPARKESILMWISTVSAVGGKLK
jgi:hypothetical protein